MKIKPTAIDKALKEWSQRGPQLIDPSYHGSKEWRDYWRRIGVGVSKMKKMKLSPRDSKRVKKTLRNPPKPNAKLLKAAKDLPK